MLARPRAPQQVVHRRRVGGAVEQLGQLGAAPAHRDHDEPVALAEQAGQMAADGRLADALAGADDGDRGHAGRGPGRRPELEVRAAVGQPRRQRPVDEPEAVGLAQHRLVGQVDHSRRRMLPRRRDHRGRRIGAGVLERHAVVGLPAQLLGAAQEQRGHDAVVLAGGGNRGLHHGRVVLTVHQDERALHHERPAALS
jgi:hypothetical protein